MANLPTLPSTARFYYRFVDSIGFGSCDGCNRIGPERHLCLHCCVSEGMELGYCNVCHHAGAAWEECDWCRRGRCLVNGYGECNSEDCDWKGPLGQPCGDCGEGVFEPIPISHLFSNAAEVTLQVVVPSSTDPTIGNSSRTRSND
jgi:hypothetical protein